MFISKKRSSEEILSFSSVTIWQVIWQCVKGKNVFLPLSSNSSKNHTQHETYESYYYHHIPEKNWEWSIRNYGIILWNLNFPIFPHNISKLIASSNQMLFHLSFGISIIIIRSVFAGKWCFRKIIPDFITDHLGIIYWNFLIVIQQLSLEYWTV